MCCLTQSSISRLGLLWGLLALTALLIAFVSGSWVYTKEPLTLPNSKISTSIAFKIGLWNICSTVKKSNSTTQTPSTNCILVKYSNWEDVTDLGIWINLDMAPVFVLRMKSCTVLCTTSVVLLLLAIFCALIGHYNSDNKTVIGCGLFVLGGLCLGTGLVIFAVSLSETIDEITQYYKAPPSGPVYEYRYGWCFFTAGIAFLMTNMAAFFSISGYLNRFSNVDDMVRQIVPGAERKLLERQHYRMQFALPQKSSPFLQFNHPSDKHLEYEAESGPLLNKTPPDVCTTNKCPEYTVQGLEESFVPNVVETDYTSNTTKTLAGQTVPITIKNHTSTAPLSFSNLPLKYGTIQYNHHDPQAAAHHQGFFGTPDVGYSSTSGSPSSAYYNRSKTLQQSKNRRKYEQTFQVPDTTFSDYAKRTNNDFSFSGSAV